MRTLRATFRLVAMLLTLVYYAFPLWIRSARGPIDWYHHQRVRQKFAKRVVSIMGIELLVTGVADNQGSYVYISNHRACLDPLIQLSCIWAFPVAKADVGKLPIVAQGAKTTGILFVDRSSGHSRRAVIEAMEEQLNAGRSILIYPEGTTSAETGTLPFKRGGFLAAKTIGALVVPVAITYPDASYYWREDQSMWSNYCRIAGNKRTVVGLHIGVPEPVTDLRSTPEEVRCQIDEWIVLATPPVVPA